MNPLDTTTDIESPEHIRFQHHVAGPARRAVAWFLDLLVRGTIVAVVTAVAAAGGLFGFSDIAAASAGLILLLLFFVEWGYYVFCEAL